MDQAIRWGTQELARWLRLVADSQTQGYDPDAAVAVLPVEQRRVLGHARKRHDPLGPAMRRYPKVLDPLAADIVDCGERSRRLAAGCREAAEALEKNRPLAFRALVFGSSLWSYFTLYLPLTMLILLVAALPAVMAVGGQWIRGRDPRGAWHRTRRHLPLLGPVYETLVFSRFAQVFAAAASSGMPLGRALEHGVDRMGDLAVAAEVRPHLQGFSAGRPVSAVLKDSAVFPSWVIHVIETAEDTGRLDRGANRLTEYLLDDAEHAVDRAVAHSLWMLPAAVGVIVFLLVLMALLSYVGVIGLEVPTPGELWRRLWERPSYD